MNPLQGQNPLAGLRDIHMPAQMPPLWPPAIGWWLLPLVLVACVLLVRLFISMRRKSLRKNALAELQTLHNRINRLTEPELAEQISGLLKRVAISRYGRAEVAKLYGPDWIAYLQNKSNTPISQDITGFLTNAPYRKASDSVHPAFANRLVETATQWIRHNT